jgi:hypothetical protein
MTTAIVIIEMKREFWIHKRALQTERSDHFKGLGDVNMATIYEMIIDQTQEIISDLTEMINQIRAIETYQKSAEQLINKKLKN